MRDPERIPRVLASVERLWRRNPDWRLGQLMANVTSSGSVALYHVEDDVLVGRLEEWAKETKT